MRQLPKQWKRIISKFPDQQSNRHLIFFLHFYKRKLYSESRIDGICVFDPLYKDEALFEEMNLPVITVNDLCDCYISRAVIPSKNKTCEYAALLDINFVVKNFSEFKAKDVWMELDELKDPYRFTLHLDFGKEKGEYTIFVSYRHFVDQIKEGREKFGSEVICQFARIYSRRLKSFSLYNDLEYLMGRLTDEEKLYLECSGL